MEGDHFVGNFRKFHRKLPTAEAEARRDQEEKHLEGVINNKRKAR
jgi:hypothetical protein